MLVAMLCFTACGSKKENLQYDKSTITQATDFLIEYCNSADADTIEQWNKMTDFQIESQLNQAGVPFTKDSFLAALDAWQQGTKECGEYVSHGDYKFEPSSDELKVTTSAKFKDRDADITFVFDEDLYLDSTTIDAHYSIGEIMEKAGLNTILGMGTVFVILIFISILISLFKYIPALEEKFKNKGKAEYVLAGGIADEVGQHVAGGHHDAGVTARGVHEHAQSHVQDLHLALLVSHGHLGEIHVQARQLGLPGAVAHVVKAGQQGVQALVAELLAQFHMLQHLAAGLDREGFHIVIAGGVGRQAGGPDHVGKAQAGQHGAAVIAQGVLFQQGAGVLHQHAG